MRELMKLGIFHNDGNQGHRKQVETAEHRVFCLHLEIQAAGKEGNNIHSPGPPVT